MRTPHPRTKKFKPPPRWRRDPRGGMFCVACDGSMHRCQLYSCRKRVCRACDKVCAAGHEVVK